jgi:hypothetical protein
MFEFSKVTNIVPFLVLAGCGGGGGGGGGEYCSSDEVDDCNGGCEYRDFLGDGQCDRTLDCAALQYDDGDCDSTGGTSGGGTSGGGTSGGGTSGGGTSGGGSSGGSTGDDCGDQSASAFRLRAVSVEAASRKPDGTDWDIGGSYPDPFACMGVGEDYWCSDTQDDTQNATFSGYYDVIVNSSDAWIGVYDEDSIDHDYIIGVDLSLSILREYTGCGNFAVSNDSGSTLVFSIETI